MRLTDIYVDGYGVLSAFSVEDLSPGLNVFFGPNEAGKTTLLDFICGALFGFPDRRFKLPYHEPVHGGRHGGSLRLLDDSGNSLLLERHTDARTPVVTTGEATGAMEVLEALLGTADDNLFRSVFAFGLSELASFETLDRDEIRDVVFSAGVLGAGRSATAAMHELESRSAEIVRQRQPDVLANRLRGELDVLDVRLRSARADALSYERRRNEVNELFAAARRAGEAVEELEARAMELQLLIGCWPSWLRRTSAIAALDALGAFDENSSRLVGHGLEIISLNAELSGHEERLRRKGELQVQLDGIGRRLEVVKSNLEPLGDTELLLERALKIVLCDDVSKLAQEHTTAIGGLGPLMSDHEHALSVLEKLETVHVAEDLDEVSLRALNGHLRELRLNLAERAAIEDRRRSEQRLEALAASHFGRGAIALRQMIIVVFVLFGMAAAGGGLLAADKVLGTLGLVVAGVAVVVLMASRRREFVSSSPSLDDVTVPHLENEIVRLCDVLGVDHRPTVGSLDELERRLEASLDEARRNAERRARADAARQRVLETEQRLMSQQSTVESLESAAHGIALELSISQPLSPAELLSALKDIETAKSLLDAKHRVEGELVELEELISRFDKSLAELVGTLGLAEQLSSYENANSTLAMLMSAKAAAESDLAHREELDRAVALGTAVLHEALGSGERAARLESLVSSGEIVDWKDEQRHLEEAIKQAKGEHRHLEDLHNSAERALNELVSSKEIADLELAKEGLESELRSALTQWLTIGVARGLLDRTLERYERERQPEVIERAAKLFTEVTDGRYVELIAHEEENRRTISAVTATGHRVDSASLSRGTAEQLYLCLRLGFATSFASKSTALPLVLDDVLVNFDAARMAAMARAMASVARSHQVLALTCHEAVADCLSRADPTLRLVELTRR